MNTTTENHVNSGMQTFAADVIEASNEALVLVDFWADWCAPCKSLAPILDNLVVQYQGAIKLVKVDTEQEQELAGQFGIRSLPTVFFFKDGQPVDQFMGAQPESAIREIIDKHVGAPGPGEVEIAQAEYENGNTDGAKALMVQMMHSQPDNDQPKLVLLGWLCAEDNMTDAAKVAEAISDEGKSTPEFQAYLAKIEFDQVVNDLPAESELLNAINEDSSNLQARLELAQRYIAEQKYAEGMDQLLEIIKQDRQFQDDIARLTLIKVFELLGGKGELASKYRRLLTSVLN